MTTSAIRAALIVAAIVVGGLVLANAFPNGSASTVVVPPGTTSSPSAPATSPSPGSSPSTSSVTIKGAVLQVLNGTQTAGLAATAAEDLKNAGAKIPAANVGNSADLFQVTTLFYRPDSKALAQLLRQRFFPGADLKTASNSLSPEIQVTVILGADYAAAHGG